MYKHGKSNHPLYRVWNAMRQRCENPHDDYFYCYGGRGISVCDAWTEDFMAFYNWAILNGYKHGLTIDRIDVNGDYRPDNCRWITMAEQQSNKRSNVYVNCCGTEVTIAEAARILNIGESTLWMRRRRGLQIDAPLFVREKPVIMDETVFFESATKAENAIGATSSKVCAVCNGRRSKTKGHTFRYATREAAEAALKEKEQENG